ncbi:MAG: hypothetical protein HY710_02945, partial [Candidatus Latescibacteria bacterium]|nr:hypothetical protein [Candidatus Latescibacterota bacterium]
MLKRVAGMFCLIVILLAGTAAVQAQPPPGVTGFTIVGPPVVVSGVPFQLDVIEHNNRQPIVPGDTSTVYLSAWDFSTNPSTPIPISPTSFVASGSGDDVLSNVTLTAPPRTWVTIRAQGYGVGPRGPNAPSIMVVGEGDRGSEAHVFGITAPFSTSPNHLFPVYITPLQPRQNVEVGNVAPFSGTVNLWADIGAISPTSVNIDVPSGGSARVLVTLDAVAPNNRIHADAPGMGGGDTPKYTVEFRNHDEAQLNSLLTVLRANLTAMAESVFVTLPGVADSLWQSTIWPLRMENYPGWQMLTFIPGAGSGGTGVQFHATLVSSAAPLSALPGDSTLWNPDFVVNTANWELVSGAFPPGLDGTYWFRYQSLSPGFRPRLSTSFVNNSSQLDRALVFVDVDGDTTVEVLSNYGIKGILWHNQIWKDGVVAGGQDTSFHVLSNFVIPPPFEGEVQLHTIYVPSIYPRPTLPDAAAWNEAFIVNPETDFADVTGDPLPPDFTGSYWTYIEVLAAPGGDRPDTLRGWSNEINTTGVYNTLYVNEAFAEPGGVAVLTVTLQHNRPVAGLQFRIEPQHWDGQNQFHAGEAAFQGVINDLENLGFTVTTATDGNGVTTVLLFSITGAVLPPGEHVLMELVYRMDENAPFGDWIMMAVMNALLSDPDSQPIHPGVQPGSIHVGRRGDLNATGDI